VLSHCKERKCFGGLGVTRDFGSLWPPALVRVSDGVVGSNADAAHKTACATSGAKTGSFAAASSRWQVGDPPHTGLADFQHGDLAAVIEAVLDDAVEEVIEIVIAARDDVQKPGIGEFFNGVGEVFRVVKHMAGRFSPAGIAGCRPIPSCAEELGHRDALGGVERDADVYVNVEDQFPNAMRGWKWTRSGLLRGDTGE